MITLNENDKRYVAVTIDGDKPLFLCFSPEEGQYMLTDKIKKATKSPERVGIESAIEFYDLKHADVSQRDFKIVELEVVYHACID